MLSLATLALFSGACLALTMTPGPDMLLIASRSASQGRAAGFASLAGIQAGTYGHAMAAAFGLSRLFLAVPMAYDAVRFAGAAYLSGRLNRPVGGNIPRPLYGWKDFSARTAHQSPQSEDGSVRPRAVSAIRPPARWVRSAPDIDSGNRP
jgi:hypothetical protein